MPLQTTTTPEPKNKAAYCAGCNPILQSDDSFIIKAFHNGAPLRCDHVGAGQAEPSLAGRLSGAGMTVALVERPPFGGACVNTGCTPTKTMVASARTAFVARRAAECSLIAKHGRRSCHPMQSYPQDAHSYDFEAYKVRNTVNDASTSSSTSNASQPASTGELHISSSSSNSQPQSYGCVE